MAESRVDIDPWVGSLSGKCPCRGGAFTSFQEVTLTAELCFSVFMK